MTEDRVPPTAADRLPVPEWGREGETWHVEPEPYIRVEPGGVCTHRWKENGMWHECYRPGVVTIGRNAQGVWCETHLREHNGWIESGQAVSWRLARND